MNLNAESYFSLTPSIDINRSKFDLSHGYKSSGCLGQVIPFEIQEVYPGDTFEYKTNAIFRLQPLVAPLMDDIVVDIYWFYEPMRVLYDRTKELFGENTEGPWAPNVEYEVPTITFPNKDISTEYSDLDNTHAVVKVGTYSGSIADYFGLPCDQKVTNYGDSTFLTNHPELIYVPDISRTELLNGGIKVSHIPFRMYADIYNEYLRSEALMNPLNIDRGEGNIAGYTERPAEADYVNDCMKGGDPLIACKKFDYFTGCLPTAQRSADPVMALPDSYVYFTNRYPTVTEVREKHAPYPSKMMWESSNPTNLYSLTNLFTAKESGDTFFESQPSNWMIDGVSVEQLRVAFQVQKYYEATARSGGRYREILESLFHVHASDQSMQIPQFLGSEQFYLNINQILQTSESGTTPQGNPAGISVTQHSGFDFIQSFTEHGFIMGVAIARYHHTYQQGIQRFWTRDDKFSFYSPQFANLGEMPVLQKEIFALGINRDEEVFGYQEQWGDLRYRPSVVTKEMRSNVTNSLDMYHLADDYNAPVYLGDKWIMEDKKNLDRCLAVTSDVADQFWFDMWFDVKATRPLPVHSIPGLIDHH